METFQTINWTTVFCRMYEIEEFALDGSFALVHEKWMTSNKGHKAACVWPASKSAMKIDNAGSGMEPDSTFKAHECCVLYSSSKYKY